MFQFQGHKGCADARKFWFAIARGRGYKQDTVVLGSERSYYVLVVIRSEKDPNLPFKSPLPPPPVTTTTMTTTDLRIIETMQTQPALYGSVRQNVLCGRNVGDKWETRKKREVISRLLRKLSPLWSRYSACVLYWPLFCVFANKQRLHIWRRIESGKKNK